MIGVDRTEKGGRGLRGASHRAVFIEEILKHLLHLLQGLDSLDEKDQQYMLLAPRFRRAYTVRAPQLSDRFREVEVVSALARLGENVEQVWWEQVGIVLAGSREKVDLLHCPYWSNPVWSPWPTVVTVHDVIQFVLPEYAWRKISRVYFGLVSAGARRADAIITVSECSKRDIVKKGVELAAPFHLTWSCYRNSEEACGVCDSCALRLRAFQEAGVEDPIAYTTKREYTRI